MTCYTLVLGKTETDAMAGETGDCDYKQLRQERGDWCCVSSYETGTVADYKLDFLLVKHQLFLVIFKRACISINAQI